MNRSKTTGTVSQSKKNKVEGIFDVNKGVEVIDSFDDFGLKEELLRGIYGIGFERPSPIQQRAILPMCQGKDLIAQAQSGTGKTATFLISSLQMIEPSLQKCQVLLLAPTRELAVQHFKVAKSLALYMEDLTILQCIGGTPRRQNQLSASKGPNLAIGTPGRVMDMVENGYLDLQSLKAFCLDEADEMLSRGFLDTMYDMFQFLPNSIQMCLFSATMPREIIELTKTWMRDPVHILMKAENLTLDGIKQHYIGFDNDGQKFHCLMELFELVSIPQMIIYCNSKQKAQHLADKLNQENFTCSLTHGGLQQSERELVMKEFRSGSSRVLVSTDLTARGIDVAGVSVVINYDLPSDQENYLHRIGRSGRFGKKGVAVNFVVDHGRELENFRAIERYYNTKILELPEDIAEVFQF